MPLPEADAWHPDAEEVSAQGSAQLAQLARPSMAVMA